MVVQEGRSEFEASLTYIGSSCQPGLPSEILSQRGKEGGYFGCFETFVLKLLSLKLVRGSTSSSSAEPEVKADFLPFISQLLITLRDSLPVIPGGRRLPFLSPRGVVWMRSVCLGSQGMSQVRRVSSQQQAVFPP